MRGLILPGGHGGEGKDNFFCFVVAGSRGGHGGYAALVHGRNTGRLWVGTSVVLSRRETTVSSLVTASYNKRCLLQYFIMCGLICFLSAGRGWWRECGDCVGISWNMRLLRRFLTGSIYWPPLFSARGLAPPCSAAASACLSLCFPLWRIFLSFGATSNQKEFSHFAHDSRSSSLFLFC